MHENLSLPYLKSQLLGIDAVHVKGFLLCYAI